MDFHALIVYILMFVGLFFEVFLLITFFEKRPKRTYSLPGDLPTVTILVPCYNEEKTVGATIESLLSLDYPTDKVSFFIIDDGSGDRTLKTIQTYAHHPQIKVFHKENGGKHTALNMGLAHVKSEFVGCLDADSFVDSQALKEIISRFDDPGIMAVTPSIKVNNPNSVLALVQRAEYYLSVFIRRTFSYLDAMFITPGPFTIFRKSVFDTLGPYREAYNTEDMEIALRIQSKHMRIDSAPMAHVFTNVPSTFRGLFRQRLRWTYGFIKNAGDYRFMFFNREYGNLGIFVLPLAIISLIPSVYFAFWMLSEVIRLLLQEFNKYQVIGFHPSLPGLGFDWFFVNTQSLMILTLMLIAMSFTVITIGKYLAADKRWWSPDTVLYFLIFGFLAPWWYSRAIYNAVTSRQGSWAREIDARRKRGE